MMVDSLGLWFRERASFKKLGYMGRFKTAYFSNFGEHYQNILCHHLN